MPEWGLLIIQLLLIAAVGLLFWNSPFVCAVGTIGFSIWLIVLSFKNYEAITWGQYWIIEVRRFVCVFGVSSFAIEDIFRFKWREDNGDQYFVTLTFVPDTFIDASWKSLVTATGCLLITDFVLPLIIGDGFFKTFRYGGLLGIIFLVPAAVLLVVEIFQLIKHIRG